MKATMQHFHAALALKLFKFGEIEGLITGPFVLYLVVTELPNTSRCQKQCQRFFIRAPWFSQHRFFLLADYLCYVQTNGFLTKQRHCLLFSLSR